jgi:hypothetical protein
MESNAMITIRQGWRETLAVAGSEDSESVVPGLMRHAGAEWFRCRSDHEGTVSFAGVK